MTTLHEKSLEGEDLRKFLTCLDCSILTLEELLANEQIGYAQRMLDDFGKKHSWDFSRLPKVNRTYKILSELMGTIRTNYEWFMERTNSSDPTENRAYFDKIKLSNDSGLPWVFDFIELSRLKREADREINGIETYESLNRAFMTTLLEGEDSKSKELHRAALKRSFLEQIKDAKLIDYSGNGHGSFKVDKVESLGGETLWNAYGVKYLPTASMFEIYVVDFWQDIRKIEGQAPSVIESQGVPILSDQFEKSLVFGVRNAPWYVLRSIDDSSEIVHPVHVTRALVGPFEHSYRVKHSIPQLNEFFAKNPKASILRFSRQYSYAPNHEVSGERTRQVIHRENLSDEILVVPGAFSGELARIVDGSSMRIYETQGGEI